MIHSFLASNLDRYAVIGNPISHSKSPFIHALFAEQTGEPITYEHRIAPIDGFHENIRKFIKEGGRGANITVPFKLNAYTISDKLSIRAADAGAVNTLSFTKGCIFGDNTDGIAIVRDIELRLGVSLCGTRILLLGAGGAARGIIMSILNCKPRLIMIVNRTLSKAQSLVYKFSKAAHNVGCVISDGRPDMVCTEPYDVIINATACSLDSRLPDCNISVFGKTSLAYDMMYGQQSTTVFTRHAASLGARVSDGLGMLVEQAAESFKIWRGIRPECAPVLAALSKHI
ncbi:MAG: shikimate dehydrogenase [Burkholderia sp.]|nr:shikimate dehydrogenase [Burkholderia sp.]